MQHLDEGTIHAWIDGELSPEQVSEVEAHASTCPECAAMVAEARGLVAAATRILTALDDLPGGVIPSVPDIAPAQVVRRRWYQRTDLRAAAAVLFVAGASLLVLRRGTDADSSRAMLATADKSQAAPVAVQTPRAGSAEVAQKSIADAASESPAATAPTVAQSPATKPLASRESSRRAAATSTFTEPTGQSLQAKVMPEARPSAIRARDETQLLKEEAAKTRAADVANTPPPFARVGAAAPSAPATPVESRSGATSAGSVEGRITDKTSGQGVANAQVAVQGTTLGATTDKDGKFRIENIPAGARRLTVRRIGYQPETIPLAIEGKEVAAANVGLAQTPTQLVGVVATSAAVAPGTSTLGASVSRAAGTGPLRVVRADSTGGTKQTVYEVSRGVEVTLSESPLGAVAERDMAANDPARQKVAAPQTAGAAPETNKRENAVSGRVAGGVFTPLSARAIPLNSISWTERGRLYVLSGRLTTKDLEALKPRLVQMRR